MKDTPQLRNKLTEFYQKHNPNEIEKKIEVALQLDVTEEQLFEMLREKYKVKDDRPAAVAVAATRSEDPKKRKALRKRLTEFYKHHKVKDSDKKVEIAMGLDLSVEELFAKLHEKYDPQPQQQQPAATTTPPPQPTPQSPEELKKRDALRKRLTEFYQQQDVKDAQKKIEVAMGLDIPEEELFAMLNKKYNVKQQVGPGEAAAAGAPTQQQEVGIGSPQRDQLPQGEINLSPPQQQQQQTEHEKVRSRQQTPQPQPQHERVLHKTFIS